jgi:hypothetical protein
VNPHGPSNYSPELSLFRERSAPVQGSNFEQDAEKLFFMVSEESAG